MATQATLERPRTVRGIQRMFDAIYQRANRRFSDGDLVALMMETAVIGVVKNARKDNAGFMLEQLATLYSRWNAVGNRLKINLQEVLWKKFPGVCSYCLRSHDCLCALNHPRKLSKSDPKLLALRKKRERMPRTLRDNQLLQKKIYYNQNLLFDLKYLASRLAEETAEVSECLRLGDREGLKMEMADVASFMFAICNRCNKNREPHEHVYLDELVWKHYPYHCKKCRYNVCRGCGKKVGA